MPVVPMMVMAGYTIDVIAVLLMRVGYRFVDMLRRKLTQKDVLVRCSALNMLELVDGSRQVESGKSQYEQNAHDRENAKPFRRATSCH